MFCSRAYYLMSFITTLDCSVDKFVENLKKLWKLFPRTILAFSSTSNLSSVQKYEDSKPLLYNISK